MEIIIYSLLGLIISAISFLLKLMFDKKKINEKLKVNEKNLNLKAYDLNVLKKQVDIFSKHSSENQNILDKIKELTSFMEKKIPQINFDEIEDKISKSSLEKAKLEKKEKTLYQQAFPILEKIRIEKRKKQRQEEEEESRIRRKKQQEEDEDRRRRDSYNSSSSYGYGYGSSSSSSDSSSSGSSWSGGGGDSSGGGSSDSW